MSNINGKFDLPSFAAKITRTDIEAIEKVTRGQRDNVLWHQIRMGRLTASNFGVILAAVRRNSYPQSFFKRVLGGQDLTGVKAIEWGINHEKTAIERFKATLSVENEGEVEVVLSGIYLDESGLLGASPDGLVGEEAVVEVKCPFRLRNATAGEVLMDPNYCFIGGEMNKDHDYYHQIQGQLYLTNRSLCYMVVWTTVDTIIYRVERDADWAKNFQTLHSFYYNIFLDKLLN